MMVPESPTSHENTQMACDVLSEECDCQEAGGHTVFGGWILAQNADRAARGLRWAALPSINPTYILRL